MFLCVYACVCFVGNPVECYMAGSVYNLAVPKAMVWRVGPNSTLTGYPTQTWLANTSNESSAELQNTLHISSLEHFQYSPTSLSLTFSVLSSLSLLQDSYLRMYFIIYDLYLLWNSDNLNIYLALIVKIITDQYIIVLVVASLPLSGQGAKPTHPLDSPPLWLPTPLSSGAKQHIKWLLLQRQVVEVGSGSSGLVVFKVLIGFHYTSVKAYLFWASQRKEG